MGGRTFGNKDYIYSSFKGLKANLHLHAPNFKVNIILESCIQSRLLTSDANYEVELRLLMCPMIEGSIGNSYRLLNGYGEERIGRTRN